MSFVTWQYAFLLGGVVLLYWPIRQSFRIWLLLAASYVFYGAWDVRFLALLLTTTVVDFFCAQGMANRRRAPGEVLVLACLPLLWIGLCSWVPWSAPVPRSGLFA